jgi:hypothetical protein
VGGDDKMMVVTMDRVMGMITRGLKNWIRICHLILRALLDRRQKVALCNLDRVQPLLPLGKL